MLPHQYFTVWIQRKLDRLGDHPDTAIGRTQTGRDECYPPLQTESPPEKHRERTGKTIFIICSNGNAEFLE
jgi:hypothetical protein